MQVVAVHVRDARLESRADQRIGVLPDGDQEVGPQVTTVDAVRELVVELVVGLVEDALLELVENDERGRIHRPDGVLDGVFEGVAGKHELAHRRCSGRTAVSSAAIRSAFESPRHALKTTGT